MDPGPLVNIDKSQKVSTAGHETRAVGSRKPDFLCDDEESRRAREVTLRPGVARWVYGDASPTRSLTVLLSSSTSQLSSSDSTRASVTAM